MTTQTIPPRNSWPLAPDKGKQQSMSWCADRGAIWSSKARGAGRIARGGGRAWLVKFLQAG